ncbi:MAG: VCBS repeat-containing protein [bacterium]
MRPVLFAALALAFAGCANLSDIDADGRCGNGVIEPQNNEDCEPGVTVPGGYRCGEVAEATRCRFTCTFGVDDKDAACPLGWGCASDGVCNAPAGAFERRRTINGLAGSVQIGDFDGDRFPDLVNVAEPIMTVAFGDAEGAFTTLVSVPIDSAPSPPVIGDLEPLSMGDEDGTTRPTDDLIVFAGRRVNIYRGRGDQELEPIAVPTGQIDVAGDEVAIVAMRGGEALGRQLAVVAAVGDAALSFVVPAAGLDTVVHTTPVAEGAALPMKLAVADLDAVEPAAGLGAVHDELAWGVRGGDTVWVHGLDCTFEGREAEPTCAFTPRDTVPVSAGWAIGESGVFFGDIDGDGVLDLVVAVEMGGRAGVGIAAGRRGADGFEGFEAMVATPAPTGMPGMGSSMAQGRIYDVADMGGGVAEVILDAGSFIFGTQPGARPQPGSFGQFDRPTQDALPVDFNQDGRIDLLTQSAQSLVLYLNVGDGRFNPLEATVPDPFDWMGTGDFDGDLLTDVMVGSANGIWIAFNTGAGVPTRFVSALDARDPIAAQAVVRQAGASFDAIDDIVAVVRVEDGGAALLELRGSGVGRLTAPFNAPTDIRAIAILRAESAAPLASRAVIGAIFGGAWSFLVLGWNDLASGVDFIPEPLVFMGEDCTIGELELLLTPVDVDGDGDEELVALETPPPGMSSDGARWVPRLLRFGRDEARCEVLDAAPTGAAPQQLVAADLDGDGQPDLLAVQRDGTPGQAAREGVIAIWWGRPDGFAATPMTCRSEWLDSRFGGALAVTELDGTPGAELVLVGDTDFHRLDVGADRALDCAAPVGLGLEGIDFDGIRTLAAEDIDVDGVLDLVVSSAERAQVIEQRPCTAQTAAEGTCAREVR